MGKAISIAEFCRRTGVSRGTWYNLKARGEAPRHYMIGARVLIPEDSVKVWEESHIAVYEQRSL
ncbi:helix-turn-helix domain-containing protein [Rhizobium sophoriradicis]|uniref:helix-turn-helix transcriptional regulator n=1 Tax=Rhizobium sophoriradicis TaxID=1535245 RepID=UPI00160899CB|nr:helix-turn-helix domain-containing protein [Rhizobium leguminosarum bv. phaseoli]